MKTDDEACSVAQVQLPGFTPDSWFPRSSRMRTQPDASQRSVPNTPHDERSLRDDFRSVKEERPPVGVRDGIGTNVCVCRRHARQERQVGQLRGGSWRRGSCTTWAAPRNVEQSSAVACIWSTNAIPTEYTRQGVSPQTARVHGNRASPRSVVWSDGLGPGLGRLVCSSGRRATRTGIARAP